MTFIGFVVSMVRGNYLVIVFSTIIHLHRTDIVFFALDPNTGAVIEPDVFIG